MTGKRRNSTYSRISQSVLDRNVHVCEVKCNLVLPGLPVPNEPQLLTWGQIYSIMKGFGYWAADGLKWDLFNSPDRSVKLKVSHGSYLYITAKG